MAHSENENREHSASFPMSHEIDHNVCLIVVVDVKMYTAVAVPWAVAARPCFQLVRANT